jgi:hypothetical protein
VAASGGSVVGHAAGGHLGGWHRPCQMGVQGRSFMGLTAFEAGVEIVSWFSLQDVERKESCLHLPSNR